MSDEKEELAVIFDLGRVLLNIHVDGPKFVALMESMDINPQEAFSTYWQEPEVEWHMIGTINSFQFYQAAVDRLNLKIDYDDFVEAWCDMYTPMPGMMEIFARVEKKQVVGLLSATDPLHWAKAKELLPWLRRIEKPTLSFETGFVKPSREIYLRAAQNCGRSPENCLFIDDSELNVDGARDVGMAGLAFTSPERLARDLAKLGII